MEHSRLDFTAAGTANDFFHTFPNYISGKNILSNVFSYAAVAALILLLIIILPCIVSIKEFGAFVEFAPGKEGMVHISKIANRRIEHVEDVLTLGDKVTVVCLGKDRMGRLSFSMKDVNKQKKNK